MVVVKPIFAGLWGHFLVGKLYEVTRKYNSYLYYLQSTEIVFFLHFIWFGCKLQNRAIFLVNASCGEVKPSKALSSALDCKNNDRNLNKV